MTLKTFVLILIVAVNGIFVLKLAQDIIKHRQELKNDSNNNVVLALSTPIMFFLSTFGISDYAMSTVLYRYKKIVPDKLLPGTLNTQCVIPVAIMALAFISIIQVDIMTLTICIVAQVIGAYIGPRFVVNLPSIVISRCLGAGLIIASILIIASKLHVFPSGGTEIGLHGIKLGIAAIMLFIFGVLNNLGIGSYAPTMVVIYALGMNPVAAFPIMMGACTFSVPIGSMEFIRYGQYSRKVTLFAATLGVIGVLLAVCLVQKLDISLLQWVIAAMLLYSSANMLSSKETAT